MYDKTMAIRVMMNHGLVNCRQIFNAAQIAGMPLPFACAQMEKETGGANIYGRSDGPRATLSGFPDPVNEDNFRAFWHMVKVQGFQSNGVGPCQITSAGLIQEMLNQDFIPWDPESNMTFGMRKLKGYHDVAVRDKEQHPWVVAGRVYNGSTAYGEDLVAKAHNWAALLEETRL